MLGLFLRLVRKGKRLHDKPHFRVLAPGYNPRSLACWKVSLGFPISVKARIGFYSFLLSLKKGGREYVLKNTYSWDTQ